TLHLEEENGWREYIFRSVDKFPEQAMPRALKGTLAGRVVEDLIASYFPAAPLLVPPFLDAVGLLHVEPVLRIMPDDPRLGVYRDTFAGMLGTVEVQPNEAPDDEPGFAGSSKIKGTEEFFNDLEESKAHRLDERRFLAARFVDFLINDSDRTRDNMRWARFGEEGDYRWRPLPIDRDWAFVNAEGWVTGLVGRVYPKLVGLGPDFPPLSALTYSSHLLDRRLLQRLTRQDFVEVADEVRGAVTDSVIEAAIAGMPERWRRETDAPERIRAAVRGRREALPSIATRFYELLAGEVDIRGTDEPERAEVRRLDDGRVRVTLTWPEDDERAGEIFYDRTFLPSETNELRLYLLGGDDRARVVGEASRRIVVRVIGGEGDDEIGDEAGGGATHLYDAEGDDRLDGGPHTRVSTARWDPPEPTEGLRLGGAWVPDWGGGLGWGPAFDYGDVAGVVIGVGPTWTEYGFRRLPYHWKVDARLLYAAGDGGVGADLAVDYRLENSPLALTLDARGVPFHSFRFNGFGNDSPDVGDPGLVPQDLLAVRPALTWHIGWRDRETGETFVGGDPHAGGAGVRPLVGQLDLGPVLLWTEPRPEVGAPYAAVRSGDGSLFRAGVRAALELDRTDRDAAPRRGWRFQGATAGFPQGGDLDRGFAEASGVAAAYVPLPLGETSLAFRLGGSAAGGGAPPEHSAWVGGRTTLRGHRWQRYRGDLAAHGSAELRAPVTSVELLMRWDLGVFALADAGRVWVDGASPGGWHTGVGGGLWLSALGQAISAAYAHGEEGRVYLQTGLSF
ncbi:MAG: BamA/TamA family outer membrane protein, partial [Gemmatimonadetes bacterium]|nr:BamA/TamA family outer membrane protein [Gemmatimonadota bacterium]NIQ52617.1 BamA/TamA family outer membrane protein [Gemmatimonadota bacterium]NIU72754.1 BamA/TamA family outer membrane protein [Gammaproteobacteria bacterium]NIX43786.1 BamA/TamA family outer membrane protein [Gemmatimonadota bacterium]NIY07988.1 BamA/TamA family outer membrane protein [Gemmatimonadota bacterium]